jgi:hypothetical protein
MSATASAQGGCLFPPAAPGTLHGNDRNFHNVDLNALSLQFAATFAGENGITVSSFVAAAWAVVLSRYAETEHVQFGFAADHHSDRWLSKEHMEVTAVSLHQDMAVKELFDKSSWDERPLESKGDLQLFNTAVVCHTNDDSGFLKSHEATQHVRGFFLLTMQIRLEGLNVVAFAGLRHTSCGDFFGLS